jgi:hypothetical protein
MLCERISFDTTTCFTTAKTHCRRALFPVFLNGHLNRIDRSCAVAISDPAKLWFPIWRSQFICCPVEAAESHRNKTIARPVS